MDLGLSFLLLAADESSSNPDIAQMIFNIIGGLGIFLLGMKNMSEGMQAVAGDKLRRMISAITGNRFMACGVGAVITCIIQSSSVTTVMVVGMVNAGIMTLIQAIGVILGANIGTTITGWLIALKVGKWGLPILGISAFIYLFSKKDRVRYTASIFLGLGMVFFGLVLMKNGFKPLTYMPEFKLWFQKFSPENHLGVIKCILVGAALTAIVQSSSATLGITISLAATGLINYPTAAALVLGENIGTTITALLASLGASRNAKRASYAHMMINILGVCWITALFFPYTKLVPQFVSWFADTFGLDPEKPYIEHCIAMTHTGFNILNVLLFLPFTRVLAKLLYKMVPDKAIKEKTHLKSLDVRMLDTPALGIKQSEAEIVKMCQTVDMLTSSLRELIISAKPNSKLEEKMFRHEKGLDIAQKEITEFVGNLMAGNVTHDVIDAARRQIRMADEYESISDYITTILKLHLKMRDNNQKMSDVGKIEILDLHVKVADLLDYINKGVELDNHELMVKVQTRAEAITILMKKYRSAHLDRVSAGTTPPLKSLIYTDMLNSYRKIKDHAVNIAEAQAGEK